MPNPLDEKLARFEELERQLVDPEVLANPARLTAVAREHGSLAKLATKYRRFKKLNAQIREAMEMVEGADPEMRELAEAEIARAQGRARNALERAARHDHRRRGRQPQRAASWKSAPAPAARRRPCSPATSTKCTSTTPRTTAGRSKSSTCRPTELGGFKEIILGLEGEGVYRKLQFESGGHRVQRVPETEAKGRIHTSAATVAVMAEPEDVEIDLKPDDYRKDIFHASGPGGQHVNKTASAIRLTHYETGIVVSCQDEKSQHKNLAKALRVLKTRLYEAKREEEHKKRSDERKTKIGSGDRSQRIRTYNFPENRLTDHRINLTLYKLDSILAGNLAPGDRRPDGIRAPGAARGVRNDRLRTG